ncbi:hypothetical protein MML48_4g00007080 [Holotrichia oblita]|uniref:Uncharacterized protein n=1 Tax=Holotrichia oblita TaxID=644536 RepID=A0ACB9T928_HOLOL|nr:hypothetical protein MML48_4g00007080 [Holotrichia oblita]
MRPDDISAVVKNDPLICLYGEALLSKHKRQQIVTVVSNKMREMGRLLIALNTTQNLNGLFDALKPEMFQHLLCATKQISGYDESTKSFKSPSLAMHMGTNLKIVCDVAYRLVMEKRNIPGIQNYDNAIRRSEIKDLRKLVEGHWCNELSSLALKDLKEKHWEKPLQLPLTSDLQLFNNYIDALADESLKRLENSNNNKIYYKQLTQCVLAKTVLFNRKRVGDVQYLKIETYNKSYSTVNPECFDQALTEVEKIISKNHKRVITGGKGSKPVPILFSKQTQKYINHLLKYRQATDIVPKSNPYLFANPDSEDRWMDGSSVIRKLAADCGAKQPELLRSTKFRKHIATTLQLMAMEGDEMEQIATFMGHTKKTHAEFYRLPQDMYQTAKVAKILLLLEQGKGEKFKGKKLNEIEIENEIYYSSESDSDEEPLINKILHKVAHTETSNITPEDTPRDKVKGIQRRRDESHPGRVRWSEEEKRLVCAYFKEHIKKKIPPKKHECELFLEKREIQW